jgi:hypothetical protein
MHRPTFMASPRVLAIYGRWAAMEAKSFQWAVGPRARSAGVSSRTSFTSARVARLGIARKVDVLASGMPRPVVISLHVTWVEHPGPG